VIQKHSITTFYPQTDEKLEELHGLVHADPWQWFNGALVADWRVGRDLIRELADLGWKLDIQ
jgi:hypothetical protein